MSAQREQIGRYHVERLLGRGGMGTVYLATDPILNRQVAIKTVRLESEDEALRAELRTRFFREAQIAAGLHHPQIVTIHDMGTHHGEPYIVMEYVAGTTLSEIVRRRDSMALSTKLLIVEQICEGLSYAHRSGIVHRDVKPGNIIVGANNHVRIVDFGIARIGDSTLTTKPVGVELHGARAVRRASC